MIDKNNPDYKTPDQETAWNAYTDLVPMELTLPMIPEEYYAACIEWHTFLTDILNDIYLNPEPYFEQTEIPNENNKVEAYIRWLWVWIYKWFEFSDSAFVGSTSAYKKLVKKMGLPIIELMSSKWGLCVEKADGEVRISQKNYPLMLTAVHDVLEAAFSNYSVNCTDYLALCDFRALVNYKRTYHDMIVLLNRDGQKMAETICEYALEHGIKPAKCTYFKRVEFKKKGKIVFVLDVAKGKNLKINIGFAEIGSPAFLKIAEVVDGYDDKDAFVKFWRKNLKKCTACNPNCQKRITPIEVFGLKTIVCQAYLRMFQPKTNDLEYIYRLISLRSMVVDAGLSEPFYPGNG